MNFDQKMVMNMGNFVDQMYDVAETIVADISHPDFAWVERLVGSKGDMNQYAKLQEIRANGVLTKYGVDKMRSVGISPSDSVYGKPPKDE